MSRTKDKMLQDEYGDNLTDFLKQLLEREELEGALNGIAKQVVTKGVSSMSEKQKAVVDNCVSKYREENVCERCSNGNVSVPSDYIFISDNTWGLCPMCNNDREKYMDED